MIELKLEDTRNHGIWDWLNWLSDNVGYYIGSNPAKGVWYGEGWEMRTERIPESYAYFKHSYTLTIANPELATLFAIRWSVNSDT